MSSNLEVSDVVATVINDNSDGTGVVSSDDQLTNKFLEGLVEQGRLNRLEVEVWPGDNPDMSKPGEIRKVYGQKDSLDILFTQVDTLDKNVKELAGQLNQFYTLVAEQGIMFDGQICTTAEEVEHGIKGELHRRRLEEGQADSGSPFNH